MVASRQPCNIPVAGRGGPADQQLPPACRLRVTAAAAAARPSPVLAAAVTPLCTSAKGFITYSLSTK